ncbi:MAG: hypothetical protein IJ565_00805 [Bacilli bacterium]|nr:hypothetical protein [Bacilli bacterium]
MKCKICGHIISSTDVNCPGCDTNVEALKETNNIIYETNSEIDSNIESTPSIETSTSPETIPQGVVETGEAPVEETTYESAVENVAEETSQVAETPVESVVEQPVAPEVAPVEPVTPEVTPEPAPESVSTSEPVAEAPVESVVEQPVASEVTPVEPVTPEVSPELAPESVSTPEPVAEAPVESVVEQPVAPEVTPVETPAPESVPTETPSAPVTPEVQNQEVPTTSAVTAEQSTTEETAEENGKKRNKKAKKEKGEKKKGVIGKFFSTLFSLIFFATIGVVAYYFLIFGKPMAILTRVVENSNLFTTSDISTGSVDIDGNIDIITSNSTSENSVLNNSEIIVKSSIDTTTFSGITNIELKNDALDKKYEFVNDGTSTYMLFDDISEEYVKVDNDYLSQKLNYLNYVSLFAHKNDINNIYNEIKKKISNFVEEDKLTRQFTTMTYSEKNMGVTKINYKLDKVGSQKLVYALINEFKGNNVIATSLANITSTTSADVINKLDQYVLNSNIDVDSIEFTLYTDYLTKTCYSIEVSIVKGGKTYNITGNYDENNKIKSIKITTNDLEVNIDNNFKKITINKTINGDTITINISYNVTKSSSVPLPNIELYSEYDETIENTILETITTDSLLNRLYSIIVKSDIIPEPIIDEPIIGDEIPTEDELITSENEDETSVDDGTNVDTNLPVENDETSLENVIDGLND